MDQGRSVTFVGPLHQGSGGCGSGVEAVSEARQTSICSSVSHSFKRIPCRTSSSKHSNLRHFGASVRCVGRRCALGQLADAHPAAARAVHAAYQSLVDELASPIMRTVVDASSEDSYGAAAVIAAVAEFHPFHDSTASSSLITRTTCRLGPCTSRLGSAKSVETMTAIPCSNSRPDKAD